MSATRPPVRRKSRASAAAEIPLPPIRGKAGIVLVLAAVLVYLPALRGAFLFDDTYLVDNPVIRSADGLLRIWFSPSSIQDEDHYMPLLYSSFWLEYRLWGLSPVGYHATNLLLHAVNTLLVWRVLLWLQVPGALAAGLLFAVHPIHVESVAWVIERKDLLSTCFYLAAGLLWLRFEQKADHRYYVASLAAFAASVLSKHMTVTFPAALLLLAWWKRGRITPVDLKRTAPFFALSAVIIGTGLMSVEQQRGWVDAITPGGRTLLVGRNFFFYLEKLAWPTDLMMFYPKWHFAGEAAYLWPIAAAALLGALWALRHKIGRGPAAAGFYFLITLSPVIGFVTFSWFGYSFVADRYAYLAGVAPLALAGAGFERLLRTLPGNGRKALAAAGIAVLAILSVLTWNRSSKYRDPVAFYRDNLSHNPAATEAWLQLGIELSKEGAITEAAEAFGKAAETEPTYALAHANLGAMLLADGQTSAAIAKFEEALRLQPGLEDARYNLELARSNGGTSLPLEFKRSE